MKPFVYSLKYFEPNTNIVRWYVGVRYAKGCDPSDLWTTYFSSSDRVKQLHAENPLAFKTKIVKIFDDIPSARLYEKLLVQRAMRFGFRLKNELINGRVPGDKWPITNGIAPSNKGRKLEDYLSPERAASVRLKLSKPKTTEANKKMVTTRRMRGSYDGGAGHPMAKSFILKLTDGTEKIVIGNLKKTCIEYGLSWQTLYNNLDKGPIILDRKRYKNLERLTERFFKTIGCELKSS